MWNPTPCQNLDAIIYIHYGTTVHIKWYTALYSLLDISSQCSHNAGKKEVSSPYDGCSHIANSLSSEITRSSMRHIFIVWKFFFIIRDPIPRWRLWLKNFFLRQQPKKWKVKTQTLAANQSSFLFEFQIYAKFILQNFVENDSNVLYILHVFFFDRARLTLNILPRYDRQWHQL